MNSGTKRVGFAFHHHGHPMRMVLGDRGPRPAHWMAWERPSETSRARTVMQKPCTLGVGVGLGLGVGVGVGLGLGLGLGWGWGWGLGLGLGLGCRGAA